MAVAIIIVGMIIACAIRPEWMRVAPWPVEVASVFGGVWAIAHDILTYTAAKDVVKSSQEEQSK